MDEIWNRDELESPCVKICVLHPEAGICIGCYRERHEIAGWAGMTAQERAAVMAELPARAGRLRKRRGGRRRKTGIAPR